jgi:ABC-2 type transport system ATP-binding protein
VWSVKEGRSRPSSSPVLATLAAGSPSTAPAAGRASAARRPERVPEAEEQPRHDRLERVLDELVQLTPGVDDPARLGADAIVVEDLGKTYPDGTEAVRGVTIRVAAGECYGLLGPNGAGKSTTVGMLGTLVRPTSGRASVAGFDVVARPREVRRRIGFAMQEVGVDAFATARELLVLQGRLHGLRRGESAHRARLLLALVDLAEVADKRLGDFSGGMQRRIDLAAALMHLPAVVFLDEPTEGLDPRARAAIWETLDRLRRQLGVTVVLTTHYMDEADQLCDRLGIIDHGRVVAEGTPTALKASVGSDSLEDVYLRYTGHAFEATERALVGIARAA